MTAPDAGTRLREELVSLRGGGSSLLLRLRPSGLPEVVHWGAALGDDDQVSAEQLLLAGEPGVPHSALDEAWPLTVLPTEADGWSGRPGLSAHRDGRWLTPEFAEGVQCERGEDAGRLMVRAEDIAAGVRWQCAFDIDRHGVLSIRQELTSTAPGTLDVAGLVALLPLPPAAEEILDFTGRWCRERSPQRETLRFGGKVRESRRGRTGHDATLLLVAGERGFTFARGEVFAVHVAWSGDHVHLVDRLPEGAGRHTAVLGGGELLRPGEVRLEEGDTFAAAPVVFARSSDGLDGLSAALHEHVRARPGHPRSPRPVTVNSWEALYFDQGTARVEALVDRAARIGAERFVLDDGWFTGRRDDTRGLGDWQVDPEVWPEGLRPVADRVRAEGMQMGLWVEPEMVSPDSNLARAHPDWVLGPARSARGTRPWRAQQVVDLTRDDAYRYILGQLHQVIDEVGVDYLKWDHNRDLHEAVDTDGQPAVRAQTLAVYRLMAELRRRHPGLEIESCASGGARVDLGVLEHTQRVWTSDCIDPLERQAIQRWTSLLVPPELLGTHVGPSLAETTGRVTSWELRCLTALFGHAGIECDLAALTEDELDRLAGWTGVHRRLRPLLHGGRSVRGEETDGAWWHGVVAPDRRHAVVAYVRLSTGAQARPGLTQLPWLDPETTYVVRVVDPTGRDDAVLRGAAIRQPPWCAEGVTLTGRLLAEHGLVMPLIDPAGGVLIEITAR
ncbi:MAG: alpha-galactosidase [Ornithinimicrobium sp.]